MLDVTRRKARGGSSSAKAGSPAARGARRSDGAAAVEFALVVPLFLLLVFGIIQYSVFFWELQTGAAAAREVARQAAVATLSCDELVAFGESKVSKNASDVLIAVDAYPNPPVIGDMATVRVEFPYYNFNFPFLPFLPDNGNISQTADIRVENVTANSASLVNTAPPNSPPTCSG
jgi:TadE-like protein